MITDHHHHHHDFEALGTSPYPCELHMFVRVFTTKLGRSRPVFRWRSSLLPPSTSPRSLWCRPRSPPPSNATATQGATSGCCLGVLRCMAHGAVDLAEDSGFPWLCGKLLRRNSECESTTLSKNIAITVATQIQWLLMSSPLWLPVLSAQAQILIYNPYFIEVVMSH